MSKDRKVKGEMTGVVSFPIAIPVKIQANIPERTCPVCGEHFDDIAPAEEFTVEPRKITNKWCFYPVKEDKMLLIVHKVDNSPDIEISEDAEDIQVE